MFSSRGSTSATPDNQSSYDDSIENSMMASGLGSGSMYKSKVCQKIMGRMEITHI